MLTDFIKKNTAHILVVLGFLLVTVAFFSPMFFEKKVLAAGDVMQGVGGGQELREYGKATGEQSLWTNSLFSGMPSIMVGTSYPGNLFHYVYEYSTLSLPRGADMIFLSLLSFYILLSVYGVRPVLAAAGAFAYAFSTYTIVSIEAGHNMKVSAMSFMPLIIAGIVLAYRRNLLAGCALMAVGLALNLITNHVQITFYTAITIFIFGLSELVYSIRQKTLKKFLLHSAALGLAAGLAVGTHAAYLLSVTEYGQYSIRGKSELKPKEAGAAVSDGLDKDYAFDWSYAKAETMTLLVPRFYGGSSNENVGESSHIYETLTAKGVPAASAKEFSKSLPAYWGDLPFTSGPLYIGAVIVFLFVLGLLVAEGQLKYWLLAATVVSVFLTWGKYFPAFNYTLFDHVPLFNKFRAVMMAIVIAQLTFPILAMVTLERIFSYQGDKKLLTKKLLIAFGATGGLCLLIALIGTSFFDFTSANDAGLLENFNKMTGDAAFAQQIMDAIRQDRESLMSHDAFRSLIFIALAAGLLYGFIGNKLKAMHVAIGCAVLVFVDLWALDKSYLNASNFQRKSANTFFAASPADEYIQKDTTINYRVLNLSGNPFTENRTSYFHKSIGGNNPAKLRRYQDLIERHLSKNNEKVLNMLNARYAIISPEQPPQLIPGALGNAWFVHEVKKVQSPDQEIEALDKFEPAYTAVVDVSKFPLAADSFDNSNARITLVRTTPYKPNYLKYTSSSPKDGLAVFSEIYYPKGWTVTIDGQPANLIRANYVLRALPVPAGNHIIEMKFDLPSYHTGNTISLICSILLFGAVAGVISFQVIKSTRKTTKTNV